MKTDRVNPNTSFLNGSLIGPRGVIITITRSEMGLISKVIMPGELRVRRLASNIGRNELMTRALTLLRGTRKSKIVVTEGGQRLAQVGDNGTRNSPWVSDLVIALGPTPPGRNVSLRKTFSTNLEKINCDGTMNFNETSISNSSAATDTLMCDNCNNTTTTIYRQLLPLYTRCLNETNEQRPGPYNKGHKTVTNS